MVESISESLKRIKIIDCHNHLFSEKNYLESLIKTMDTSGIDKTCISGIGPLFYCGSNEDVKVAFQRYPDRIIGAYWIRPGFSKPAEIDEAYSNGFKMIKVTLPNKPYFDESFFGYWEKAVEYKMPVLFHTGVVTTAVSAPQERVNSWNMQPLMLEPVANAFPKLNIIIAHLGVHLNMDAAELARMKSNVYVDLTGEPKGWRARVEKEGFEKYLWWEGAFDKVVFGTDVHYSKIATILEQDHARYLKLGLSEDTLRKIFYENMNKMLHM